MEQVNPESVVAVGNVQTAGDQIKYLPRFCRLYDLPKTPGLFLPDSAPQQRNAADLAQQRNAGHGENRGVSVCGSPHDPEKE